MLRRESENWTYLRSDKRQSLPLLSRQEDDMGKVFLVYLFVACIDLSDSISLLLYALEKEVSLIHDGLSFV